MAQFLLPWYQMTPDDVYTYQLNYVEAGSYKLALVCNASADELTEGG